MKDEDPISSALAALFFAICAIVIITVPSWGPWVDSLGDRHSIETAERHAAALEASRCK